MTHRTLGRGVVDPLKLTWVSSHDLLPPGENPVVSDAERQRSLEYLEQCYVMSGVFMTPETNNGCALCARYGPRTYSRDPALTDGTWWFAFTVQHYLREHGFTLPQRVLARLRRAAFKVPALGSVQPSC